MCIRDRLATVVTVALSLGALKVLYRKVTF